MKAFHVHSWPTEWIWIETEAEAVWEGCQVAAKRSDMAKLWLVVAWV